MALGVQTFLPRPTSGGGGGILRSRPQSYPQSRPQSYPPAPSPTPTPRRTPAPADDYPNPPGRGGGGNDPQFKDDGLVPGMGPPLPHTGGIADQWTQWQTAADAITQAQYDLRQNALLRQRAALGSGGGSGGNRSAYDAAMQALTSDRTRLAADQALSAAQRGFAGTNLELANRSQRGALMSDAVSRGASTSAGVAQNYTDISDKNQLNYDQSIAQADRNDKYLSQLAKDYGVREDQIKAALTRGAARYGMSYANAMAQIDDAMQSNDLERRAAALQVQYQILQAGGTLPSTGGSGSSSPYRPTRSAPRKFV